MSETKIIIIDPQTDGIESITRVLQGDRYDRVHIISHGAPGCLNLGNSQLSLDTIDTYAPLITTWFDSKAKGDLLLYGCNFAAGDAGAESIAKLQQLTGVDIAASATPTGNSVLGGNWELEVTTCNRNFSLAVTEIGQKTYSGVLATFRVNTIEDSNNNDSDLSLREAITAANSNEGSDLIQFAASIENSTISLQEGALTITDSVTIQGGNGISIDGGNQSGVFKIDDSKAHNFLDVSIDGVTITGGKTAKSGGAIVNAERLQLSNSTIEDNVAAINGGAIDNTGNLNIINSTISNNKASSGGGLVNSGTAKISNTTISGNQASLSGGGIENNLGTLTASNSTIVDNAAESGSGINSTNGVKVALTSTIVAANEANDDIKANSSVVSGGNNLIGNGDNATGFIASDLVGGTFAPLNPQLSPLQNNGGKIDTHRLLSGSLAIDAGSNLDELTVDARARPVSDVLLTDSSILELLKFKIKLSKAQLAKIL